MFIVAEKQDERRVSGRFPPGRGWIGAVHSRVMAALSPAELGALWPELEREILAAESIIVGTHVNPDGDALGSALAFSQVLDQLGKTHVVACHHEPPSYLRFIPHLDRLQLSVPEEPADLAIVLDLEALDRLGSLRPAFEQAKRMIVIDHHEPHEMPGDLRVISVNSPACAAILADIIKPSPITMTPQMATCLLTGILTDTGNFRFPNTTSHSLHVAAELLEAGADLRAIVDAVYMTRSLPAVKLSSRFLANMRLSSGDQVAWSKVGLPDFEATGAREEDTEGFVNDLLSIESVKIAALLRQVKPGKVKISLRSRGSVDVTLVAREFGGGGHKNASGASYDGDIDKAEKLLVEAMEKCLASS